MSIRPIWCLVICQVLVALIGSAVFYFRSSGPSPPPTRPHHLSYQASRSLTRNHLIEPEDLTSPAPLPKGKSAILPKKTELTGRYLTADKRKGDPILTSETATRPFLDASPEMAYYFLELGNQAIPVSLLDAGTKIELSYCANPSDSRRECTPTARAAEIGAVLCDASQPRKCEVAIKISRIAEAELGHSPASEPIRLFLLGQ